jgi:16S rRNA (guanine527-N7)-methyltransferase
MCDIGSGAGFPGIPVKIAFPHVHMTLVEPLQKRCRFLNEVKTQLNLENLDILNVRAEDLAKEKRECFDVVSARAVAKLSIADFRSSPKIASKAFSLFSSICLFISSI